MTDKDKTIRKLWLISYFVITIANLVYSQIQHREFYSVTGMSFWMPLTIILIGSLVMLYIFYYCAYKNPGTKLLTFLLIIAPIFVILNLVFFLQGIMPPDPHGIYPLQVVGTIYLYVLTWKMRTVNKKLQSAARR